MKRDGIRRFLVFSYSNILYLAKENLGFTKQNKFFMNRVCHGHASLSVALANGRSPIFVNFSFCYKNQLMS